MGMTLKQIAEHLGGELVGDGDLVIERVAPIEAAQPGDLSFITNKRYMPFLRTTRASALIVAPQLRDLKHNLIVLPNPYLGFARAVGLLMEKPRPRKPGIHSTATVSPTAKLGRDVEIGPYCTIEDDAEIGDNAALMAGVRVGRGAVIGEASTLHPNVTLYHDVRIGKRCVLHGNVTIGSDGFGWAPNGAHFEKIPQVGTTVIGDDVSVGANSVINRGALQNTTIGRGTKIDSLVVISHNVTIGEDCLFVSQVGISGSVRIGSHCEFGGQAGVAGHLVIGDNVRLAAQSGVSHDLPADGTYFGSPARPISEMRQTVAALHKLPELRKEIRHVQKRMEALIALFGQDLSSAGRLPAISSEPVEETSEELPAENNNEQ